MTDANRTVPRAARWGRPATLGVLASAVATALLAALVVVGATAGGAGAAVGCATDGPYAVGARPMAVAAGDFDGDGHVDVVTADQDADTVSVLENTGDGELGAANSYPVSLAPEPAAEPSAVTVAELTGDETLDVAVANKGHDSVAVLAGQGDGSFSDPVEFPTGGGQSEVRLPFVSNTPGGETPVDVIAVDVDGDGDQDLATANRDSEDVSVLLNAGVDSVAGPFFARPTVSSVTRPTVSSVRGRAEALTAVPRADGGVDLAVATVKDPINPSDRTATEVAVLPAHDPLGEVSWHPVGGTHGVASDDLDADGDQDLATSELVLVNPGDGLADATRRTVANLTGVVAIGDVDGDGPLDLAVTDKFTDEVAVLAGAGDATFTQVAACAVAPDSAGITAGDVDGDGRAELVTVSETANTVSVTHVQLAEPGGVAGTVTSAESGEALADVEVTVADDGDDEVASIATGPNGGYAVDELPPGDYTVTADHADYQPATHEATVTEGETPTVDFALPPIPDTGAVAGTVTSRSDEALAGAEVTVTDADDAVVGATTTGPNGGYAVDGLTPGEHTVTADHSDYEPASQDAAVARGETTTVDLALQPASGAVAGTVTDADSGAPLAGVEVTVLGATGREEGTATTGEAGGYRIDISKPGEYTVVADGDAHQLESAEARVPAGQTATVDFALTAEPVGCAETAYDVGDAPVSVATADFDGDGHPDAATANRHGGTVSVLLGDGDGGFAAASDEPASRQSDAGPAAVVAADLDDDGVADLAVANQASRNAGGQASVAVLRGRGDGTFAEPVEYPLGASAGFSLFVGAEAPVDLVAADFDGDGDQDLATANADSEDVAVLANTGAGAFAGPQRFAVDGAAQALMTAQLDGDQHPDLAVTTAAGQVAVLAGNGDATFQTPATYAVGADPEGIVAADLDGDGDQDLATANADSGDVAVLDNTGDGGFAAATRHAVGAGTEPYDLAATDLDGDGHHDLATATNTADDVALLAGDGDGTYTRVGDCPAGNVARAVAVADVDGDAHPDVLAANMDSDTLSVGRITGSVAGTVTDAASGAPVAGAAVTVTDADGDTAGTANTDSDGGYTVADLPAATYTVTADHPDYQPASDEAGVVGTETATVDFALEPAATPTGTLVGTVTDADTGDPIEDADITVTDADGNPAATAATAGDGGYELSGLEPGDYTVTADHADYQAHSTAASVTAGETTPLDFALTPASDDDGSNDDSGGDGSGDGGSDDDGSGDDSDGGSGDGGLDGDGDGDSSDGGSADGDGGGGSDSSGGDGGSGRGDDTSDDEGGGQPAGPAAAEAGVSRIAGADRFATAAALSQRAYPDGADVVYVATGFGFADALTGGVAAAVDQAPLLLVTRSDLPQATAGELDRLAPDRVVILGGRGVIDASVAQTLAGHAGRVDRLAGADRFATARAVAEVTFPDADAVDTVYVASGHTFADALAGGPAAAETGAPLLLATRDGLPAPTRAALDWLAPDRVVLLGGPAALGAPVAEAASGFADTVDRLAGATRFATAATIATDTFRDGADQILVATGTEFPDALAGGAVAGAAGQPVLLAAPGELTAPTRTAVGELSPAAGWLLGGPAALGEPVETELNQLLGDGGNT